MGPVLAVGGCREARTWSLQGGRRPMGPGRAGPMRSSVAAPDCCGGLGNLDFRKADLCVMTWLLGYVDPSEPHFVAAVLTIAFNPLFWNVLHAGHAEPTQDAEPGQPLGLPHGPGTPGSGRRVCPFQFPGSGLHGDLPRRLLRDPEGDQSDHVPVQHPGQPHVLGQHSQLPGLGHHAADSVLERLGWEAPCPRPGCRDPRPVDEAPCRPPSASPAVGASKRPAVKEAGTGHHAACPPEQLRFVHFLDEDFFHRKLFL
ncbi:phosphatidylethanolamine N-methyltransferase isoform X5 [Monodon monoceros]|uniref:phosphatidylethanolamine N-methyltransferase isoform X5 n=1 Tax=Monodon monoceros TaxID=40151 RepID=UPI0010F51123|nr:phosphatidylethanolamine N-methyltransferase isoform X5 [Monodon monoceros]